MADSGNCKELRGRPYLVPVVFDKEQEENMEGQREKHEVGNGIIFDRFDGVSRVRMFFAYACQFPQ